MGDCLEEQSDDERRDLSEQKQIAENASVERAERTGSTDLYVSVWENPTSSVDLAASLALVGATLGYRAAVTVAGLTR